MHRAGLPVAGPGGIEGGQEHLRAGTYACKVRWERVQGLCVQLFMPRPGPRGSVQPIILHPCVATRSIAWTGTRAAHILPSLKKQDPTVPSCLPSASCDNPHPLVLWAVMLGIVDWCVASDHEIKLQIGSARDWMDLWENGGCVTSGARASCLMNWRVSCRNGPFFAVCCQNLPESAPNRSNHKKRVWLHPNLLILPNPPPRLDRPRPLQRPTQIHRPLSVTGACNTINRPIPRPTATSKTETTMWTGGRLSLKLCGATVANAERR